MRTFDADAIYALLPVTVRTRDLKSGSSLRALIGVVASQAQLVDDSLYQLYDDSFIETCSPWAIDYIGELIGHRPLRPIPPADGTARADVADTIGMRRRKGTLVMLDQLARDVTAWPAVAVEFFALLAVSQYVRNHVRLQNACVDVHSWAAANDAGTAFDLAPRTADVRRIASGRGRYNIPNIGIFLYRLRAYGGATIGQVPSTAASVGANRYRFDPFDEDVQLVNPPAVAPQFTLSRRANVPYPLHRIPLYVELNALRAGTLQPDQAVYFGAAPVFTVFDGSGAAIAPQHVAVCDLQAWQAPSDSAIHVAVDPELGRFMFNPSAIVPPSVPRVAYAYAFSGDYGGGTYVRTPPPTEGPVTRSVDDFAAASPSSWTSGVVEIGDSGIFEGNLTLTPSAAGVVVRAADDARPVVHGNLTVVASPGTSLTLRGIGVTGELIVVSAPSSSSGSASSGSSSGIAPPPSFALNIEHCSLRGALTWTFPGGGTLAVASSLCGVLAIHPTVEITISDSVVDGGSPDAGIGRGSASGSSSSSIGASSGSASAVPGEDAFVAIVGPDRISPCGDISIAASTVFGRVLAREAGLIENSILTGAVRLARTQSGCVRYSYLPPPPDSRIPPSFRCQPDLASASDPTAASWLVPAFTSRARNAAGYAQLADTCPIEIRTGAESGDEMGVFLAVYAPRREANLRFRFEEYLRIGLEAGIIHAS